MMMLCRHCERRNSWLNPVPYQLHAITTKRTNRLMSYCILESSFPMCSTLFLLIFDVATLTTRWQTTTREAPPPRPLSPTNSSSSEWKILQWFSQSSISAGTRWRWCQWSMVVMPDAAGSRSVRSSASWRQRLHALTIPRGNRWWWRWMRLRSICALYSPGGSACYSLLYCTKRALCIRQ